MTTMTMTPTERAAYLRGQADGYTQGLADGMSGVTDAPTASKVRDKDGDVWTRCGDGTWIWTEYANGGSRETYVDSGGRSYADLHASFGPLLVLA